MPNDKPQAGKPQEDNSLLAAIRAMHQELRLLRLQSQDFDSERQAANQVVLEGKAGTTVQVLDWAAKGCDARPIPMPVVVNVDYDANTSGEAVSTESVVIRVDWGPGHWVELDLVKGLQLALTGHKLTLKATYGTPNNVQNTLVNVTIRASIGPRGQKGTPGVTSNARRTLFVGAVGQTSLSSLQPIPQWAISACFQGTDVNSPSLELRQYSANTANAFTLLSAEDIGKGTSGGVPIVQGASHFALYNPTAGAIVGRVQFNLGI